MVFTRSAAVTGLALACLLPLSGCFPTGAPSSDGTTGPSASTTAAPPSSTPSPATPTFTLPASCTAIASASTLSTVFADVPSRPPGDLVRPAPASAKKLLTCSWFAGDVTGGDVIYYSAAAADDQAYLSVMTADGYACTAALGGTRCDKTTPDSQYPVSAIETTFTRDDVWIYLSTTNVDATSLLPDMVATAWAN